MDGLDYTMSRQTAIFKALKGLVSERLRMQVWLVMASDSFVEFPAYIADQIIEEASQ